MPLTTEDKLDILDNIARRAHYSDYPDTEAWVSTWTDDAVLEMPADVTLELPGGATAMETTIRGHQGLRDFLNGHLPSMVGLRHWTSNVYIEGDGDEAKAVCIFNLIDTGKGGESVVTGRYINTMRKTADGWKLAHQICEMDGK
jgi:ketosteroid isomerase-like protein